MLRQLASVARKAWLAEDLLIVRALRPLHVPEFPIVVLITPKAGCTTITKWFLFQTGRLDESIKNSIFVHSYRMDALVRQRGYRRTVLRVLRRHEKHVLKLVRNPYDRAVSSFFHVLHNAVRPDESRWERQLISAARTRARKPQSEEPRMSFRDFLRHLASVGSRQHEANHHVAQQYVPSEERFVSQVMRLERFEDEIRQVEARFGLKRAPLEEIARSNHHKSAEAPHFSGFGGCAADIEFTPRDVIRKEVPNYQSLYDDETREIVATCFAADFKAYGYSV